MSGDRGLPTSIGRYQVRSLLGRGGMGKVYGALDPSLDRLVAIKTVASPHENRQFVERLKREAKACGRLQHPGIVTIHDLGEENGEVFFAMEWLQGETLTEAMKGGLPLSTRVAVLLEILDALHYAHEEGIVHRDIKPGNIWVLPSGRIKILDFGLARVMHADGLTQTGDVMGTPYYMSPEQLKGQPVDRRSDVFSTGVLGYELLARRRAFDGATITEVIIKILGEEPSPISAPWSHAFPELEAILRRAMAKPPEERFATAVSMADELRQVLQLHGPAMDAFETRLRRESEADTAQTTGLIETGPAVASTALLPDPRPHQTPASHASVAAGAATVIRPQVAQRGDDRRPPDANAPATGRPVQMWVWLAVAAGLIALVSVAAIAIVGLPGGPDLGRDTSTGPVAASIPVPAPGGGGGGSEGPVAAASALPAAPAPQSPAGAPAAPITQGNALPPRGAGARPSTTQSGVYLDSSNAEFRNLLGQLLAERGVVVRERPGEAAWVIQVSAQIEVRPGPENSGALTADYLGDLRVSARDGSAKGSKHFEGHALEFGQAVLRSKAARELAAKMVEYLAGILKFNSPV